MVGALRQRFAAALRQRKDNILQVSLVIDQIRQGKMKLDDAARQIAESGRLLDVAALLAAFVRLERDQVFQHVYRGQLQTVLILCRALDLTWPTLDAILAVRAAKNHMRYVSDPTVRRDYEAVDPLIAQRAIRFLRVRQVAGGQAVQVGAA